MDAKASIDEIESMDRPIDRIESNRWTDGPIDASSRVCVRALID
jgi:hypothetical protein